MLFFPPTENLIIAIQAIILNYYSTGLLMQKKKVQYFMQKMVDNNIKQPILSTRQCCYCNFGFIFSEFPTVFAGLITPKKRSAEEEISNVWKHRRETLALIWILFYCLFHRAWMWNWNWKHNCCLLLFFFKCYFENSKEEKCRTLPKQWDNVR